MFNNTREGAETGFYHRKLPVQKVFWKYSGFILRAEIKTDKINTNCIGPLFT